MLAPRERERVNKNEGRQWDNEPQAIKAKVLSLTTVTRDSIQNHAVRGW
jgi:hypothetical protein